MCSPPATISISALSKYSKRPFLLLEILIAILLVSLCLVPLIQGPILGYRKEMLLLEEIEGERLAEWSFSEVKEKLFNREIAWSKLPGPDQRSALIPLPAMTLQIPGANPKKIERAYSLRCHKNGEKVGLKGEVYKMLYVDIHFSPRLSQNKKRSDGHGDYSYRIVVQKTN